MDEATQVVVWDATVNPPNFIGQTTAYIQPIDRSVHIILDLEGLQTFSELLLDARDNAFQRTLTAPYAATTVEATTDTTTTDDTTEEE